MRKWIILMSLLLNCEVQACQTKRLSAEYRYLNSQAIFTAKVIARREICFETVEGLREVDCKSDAILFPRAHELELEVIEKIKGDDAPKRVRIFHSLCTAYGLTGWSDLKENIVISWRGHAGSFAEIVGADSPSYQTWLAQFRKFASEKLAFVEIIEVKDKE